jgi:Ethylbenzene dehydrogenase/Prokaryotic cytochrome b561
MIHSSGRPRADLPTVVLHWLAAAALAVSLGTGLRISIDTPGAVWSRFLSPLLPQGAVSTWHLYSAYTLTILAVAYILFLWRAHLGARVRPSVRALGTPDRETRWRAINRILYWVAFAGIAVQAVTGSLLYFAPGLLPVQLVAAFHRGVAWALIAYTGLHVAAQFGLGGIRQVLKIVNPRLAYIGAGALTLGISIAVTAIVYPVDYALIRPLHIMRVSQEPVIDGDPSDPVWQRAQPVEIHTTNGANLPGGEVTVRVRGVHHGERVSLLFEWPDTTHSQKHLPLRKTTAGWQVVETNYSMQDENTYYEDKFAVMLSASAQIGGGSTHFGPRPIADKPGPIGQRGLHYTTDGSIVDVWHWKSVRTGPLGQIDDNYFGPPLPAPHKPGERYTGGYTQDPKERGGYEQNWTKLDGSPFVVPKRLPKDFPAQQARFGTVNLDPNVSDHGQWWMALEDTVPYRQELDTYPLGTLLPSILIDKPFVGDRGDVTAVGTWKDGWWRLEVTRQLDTKSKFDLPMRSGLYLWVAVFDHTQTRHSRHLHPVRIAMEQDLL